mgnify:FL=1
MLTRNELAKQRWAGAHAAIDVWLQARQELLVEYFMLAGLPPYARESQALPAASDITHFCGLLMDYVSAGHFEIYDKVIRNSQGAPAESLQHVEDDVFPHIAETTNAALDFNDTYGHITADTNLPKFDADLSVLGEALSLRMELEDQLLAMLEQHQLL